MASLSSPESRIKAAAQPGIKNQARCAGWNQESRISRGGLRFRISAAENKRRKLRFILLGQWSLTLTALNKRRKLRFTFRSLTLTRQRFQHHLVRKTCDRNGVRTRELIRD